MARNHKYGIEWFCCLFKDWHVWKWYSTKQRRDQALKILNRKASGTTKFRKKQ